MADDPHVAIVIDPITTLAQGSVSIGAFRSFKTRKLDYIKPITKDMDAAAIEANIRKYGSDWQKYYELKLSIYKSSLESDNLDLM